MAAKQVARSPADSTPELLAQCQCDPESAVKAFEAAMLVVGGETVEYGKEDSQQWMRIATDCTGRVGCAYPFHLGKGRAGWRRHAQ